MKARRDYRFRIAIDGSGGADTLTGIDVVLGSPFDDNLTGDARANRLRGGQGNDALDGGGGADGVDHAAGTAGFSSIVARKEEPRGTLAPFG